MHFINYLEKEEAIGIGDAKKVLLPSCPAHWCTDSNGTKVKDDLFLFPGPASFRFMQLEVTWTVEKSFTPDFRGKVKVSANGVEGVPLGPPATADGDLMIEP